MPYRETEAHGPNWIEPPPDIIEGEPEWEVEQILQSRRFGRTKKKQYLVRWKGYLPSHDSWVDEADMNAADLVTDFYTNHPTAIRSCLKALETTEETYPPCHELAPSLPTVNSDQSKVQKQPASDRTQSPSPINTYFKNSLNQNNPGATCSDHGWKEKDQYEQITPLTNIAFKTAAHVRKTTVPTTSKDSPRPHFPSATSSQNQNQSTTGKNPKLTNGTNGSAKTPDTSNNT